MKEMIKILFMFVALRYRNITIDVFKQVSPILIKALGWENLGELQCLQNDYT